MEDQKNPEKEKKLIHDTNYYTDQCEIHKTLAETQHVIFGCVNAREEQEKLLTKINKRIRIILDDNNCPEVIQWWENEFSYYNIKDVEKDKKKRSKNYNREEIIPKTKKKPTI